MRSPFAIPCLTLAILLGTSAATSAATPAAAASSAYEVVTRTVKFDDLNLKDRNDVATLYARIKAAANEVCEPLDSRSIDTLLHMRRCKEQAISRAVTDAQSSLLETFHMAATNQLDSVLSR